MPNMATRRQRSAVDKLVEIGGTSVSRAMREAEIPYSPVTAKNPKHLTESKGFQELLKEYGLTQGFITRALVNDIKAKPKNRLGELRLGAEILNLTQGEKTTNNKVLIINIPKELAEKRGITNGETSDNSTG